uniref:Uncharacterized protein n=1 Tax=Anguilla anguilla TaxID=7936 RepID=A0A0E9XY69_ANGAN
MHNVLLAFTSSLDCSVAKVGDVVQGGWLQIRQSPVLTTAQEGTYGDNRMLSGPKTTSEHRGMRCPTRRSSLWDATSAGKRSP